MINTTESTPRSGLGPAALALALSVLALALSIGFLVWRGAEQRHVLDAGSTQCRAGALAACDGLRSMCLKRSGEACTALADSILAAGASADVREGMRLLKEGCLYRDRGACLRAGKMYLSGDRVGIDRDLARSLLGRACELGAKEGCGLK